MQHFLDAQAEADHLANVLAAAQGLGVRTVSCEYCGSTIDLNLLAHPVCHDCNRNFRSVGRWSAFLGRKRYTVFPPTHKFPRGDVRGECKRRGIGGFGSRSVHGRSKIALQG